MNAPPPAPQNPPQPAPALPPDLMNALTAYANSEGLDVDDLVAAIGSVQRQQARALGLSAREVKIVKETPGCTLTAYAKAKATFGGARR